MISDDGLFYHDLLVPELQRRGHQVTQAKSIAETKRKLKEESRPDVILLDVDFSRSGEGAFAGLGAANHIRKNFPTIALLVWSQHNELRIAREVMTIGQKGGRVGYILKDKLDNVSELLAYAHTVQGGGICIDAELHGFTGRGGMLTAMQRKVVELIARGLANKAIGGQLNMSNGTVERHIGAIRRAYEIPSPEDAPEVNIRVLIVLAYLNDITRHNDHDES
ncbi:LuxR C-terminal-related transcriptional regulator [Streptomyces sp. NPDC002004]